MFEAPVYDEFVSRVTEMVRGLRQGEPTGVGSVDVGAVVFAPQLKIIDDHVRDAVAKGARVLTGGHAHSERGRYYEPTVLVDVDHTMRCMREETFGPTLPIMKIHAGVVCINEAQVNYSALNLPMGGWKTSGVGTRHGANGIRKYTKIQSLLVTRAALKREPFMFPYRARRTMMLRRVFRLLYGRGTRD